MNEQIKNWLKTNWFKAGLLIILIICIGGAFYWYEWRPSEIRKECVKTVMKNLSAMAGANANALDYQIGFQISLDMCLLQHGLAK